MRPWSILPAIALASSATLAAEPDPASSPQGWVPEEIPWQARGAQGTRFALLEGRRDQAGTAFTYAFSIPAGVWDSPHSHSSTARVFVARGALRIGYGASADRARARTYPAGSVIVVPAGAVHYDGADEDTVIIGVASGPWSTTYLDGSAPASAGTPLKR
ncbi:cupin domain-containing protein [Novosphingobium huizhouense]|uniref:cupin domain-containing protein n=1 Tax=Novosphingobium huizhouense TaxID=2866625 RepID=UPI001CD908BF|nr:cupin domain-containing protein [Novosphingobium huizhouense]